MSQCPICKTIQPDGQLFCTDCGSRLVPVQQEAEKKESEKRSEEKPSWETAKYTKTASSKSSKTARVILVLLLAAALIGDVYFYSEYSRYSDQYWDMWDDNWQIKRDLQEKEEELSAAEEKLARAREEQAQTEKELDRFSELSGLCGYGTENYYADKYILVLGKSETRNVAIHWNAPGSGSAFWSNSDTGKTSCKWADSWTDSTTIDVIVTGQSTGYSILSFTNDLTDDAFDMLVVVR